MKNVKIELNPEYLIGKLFRALVEGRNLSLVAYENEKEGNIYRPDFKSKDGISIWLNEE